MSEANKFRIWSKKYKMFTSDPRWPNNQHTHEEFLLSPAGEVWCLVTADNENYFRDLSLDDDYIVQRATGLKDKTDKEIYEGDIVKTDLNHELAILSGESFPFYAKGIVIWLREGFEVCQAYIGATKLSDFASCDCHPCGLEIIGNILENPELA